MDSQVVELLGRNRLVSELLYAGLEVSLPLRDRGVDLIAYADKVGNVYEFTARPIQMKASTTQRFEVNRKYYKFPDLIIAYVWNLSSEGKAVTYAMTYQQTRNIAKTLGWTKTASWENGRYVTTSPSKDLVEWLESAYRVTRRRWWDLVVHGVGT